MTYHCAWRDRPKGNGKDSKYRGEDRVFSGGWTVISIV
jgi:hypothetical protein